MIGKRFLPLPSFLPIIILLYALQQIQKDTTTYITISNDVLNFTISRLTICRNSVVKYKYQPS